MADKKPVGRPPKVIPGIPDTFENIVKAVVRTQPKPPKDTSRTSR